ncbi:cupin domain-containing protein [Oceanobacillus salinisoli]|uniref:cupin domain-containing protein n=1 Tax=Oceanobacillus salinisoli TaxID=2678611 RepID=UPI0012E1220E|nr:cupin domain-containing protein [Oceanobacillus salinisoli]
MYYVPYMYPCQYPINYNVPMYDFRKHSVQWQYANSSNSFRPVNGDGRIALTDYGPRPFVVNINEVTKQNNTFRTALWTGSQFQVTLMSLDVGEDIGLEMHPDVDQFLRVEQGQGIVRMGESRNDLNFERNVYDDSAVIIPAGTWHNLINTGTVPLKLYSIYAPPNHPFGTVHVTKADAMAAEEGHANKQ